MSLASLLSVLRRTRSTVSTKTGTVIMVNNAGGGRVASRSLVTLLHSLTFVTPAKLCDKDSSRRRSGVVTIRKRYA